MLLTYPKNCEPNVETYIEFIRDVRDDVINKNPDLPFREINKKISKMWSKLSYKEKQYYIQKEFLTMVDSLIENSNVFSKREKYYVIGNIDLDVLEWRTYLFNRNLSNFKMLEKEVNDKKEEIKLYKEYCKYKLKKTNIPNDIIQYCIFPFF